MIPSFSKTIILLSVQLFIIHFAFSQSNKIEIIDYYTAPCGESTHPDNLQGFDHVVSELLYGDTLRLIISTSGNCDGIKYPFAKLVNDTLWLTYKNGGGRVEEIQDGDSIYFIVMDSECDCYFNNVFLIKGIYSEPKVYCIPHGSMTGPYYHSFHNKPYKRGYSCLGDCFEIINGDTVNLMDKFGFKQGLWIKKPPKLLPWGIIEIPTLELEPEDEDFIEGERLHDSYRCFYVNNEIKNGEIIKYYQPYNVLKYHKIYKDFTYAETFYDPDGNITKIIKSPQKEE